MKIKILPCLLIFAALIGCKPKSESENQSRQSDSTKSSKNEPFAQFFVTDETTDKSMSSSSEEFSDEAKNYVNGCDGVFSIVYQKLSLKSDKHYLETLNYLYESKDQTQLDERRKSAIGISVPDYGVGSWKDNKSKVKTIYSQHRNEVQYSLSSYELLELNEVFSRSEDVEKAIIAWNSCIAQTSQVPHLIVRHNDSSTVIVSFKMFRNDFVNSWSRVKVRKIIYSDNLILEDNSLEGKRIKYTGEYTLKFIRKNRSEASINVDLEKGNIIPVTVPALPRNCETIMEEKIYVAKADINVKKSRLIITSPEGIEQLLQFKEQNRSRHKWRFKVKTKLKNNEAVIQDYFITGVTRFVKEGVIVEPDGTLTLDCWLQTASKVTIEKFVIIYSQSSTLCPDEE